ncbi:MAG: lamin tail domain-containing protein [Chloroflexota bacterium]
MTTSFSLAYGAVADVGDLKINEFMASNNSSWEDPDEPGTYPDWIEIYNSGETAVDLQGLYITDDPAQPTRYQIPSSIVVPAKGFVLFYADGQPEQGASHTNFGLGAGGEDVLLVDSDGSTVIDSRTFGAQTADISEGRFPDGGDSWQNFTAPTPGSSNAIGPIISDVTQTPDAPSSSDAVTIEATITDNGSISSASLFYSLNEGSFTEMVMSAQGGDVYAATIPAQSSDTIVDYYVEAIDNDDLSSTAPAGAPAATNRYIVGFAAPMLYINEFVALNTTLPDPDDPLDRPDWIEIYNAGETDVDLNGYYLTDDLADLTLHQVSGSVVVPAKGFVLFYADGTAAQGVLHTSFRLSSTNGEDLAIVAPDGNTIVDSYTFGPQTADISEGRLPDGADNWVFFDPPTPGASNSQAPKISDTTKSPDFPTSSDGVEVTTTVTDDSSVTVTLFYVVDGVTDSVAMASIGGNQYRGTIPAQADGKTVHYYISATDEDPQTVYDPPAAPAETYLYIVGYQPPAVYINEFMADNASTLTDPAEPLEFPDWIELYNEEGTAVDLNGYYLTDDPADLTKSPITETLTIPAGGFLLVYADNDPEQGPEHTNFGLSSSLGESILLVAPDGTSIVDSYTFGPQMTDVSEGRLPDGDASWVFFNVPTPGSSNALFPPAISDTNFAPNQPGESDSVTVTSTMSDDGLVVGATLFYRTGGSFMAAAMTPIGGNQFQATIPAQPTDTQVDFYVTAQDNDGLISSDPPTAPEATYSYIVGYTPPNVTINEFMASNESTLEDPDEPGDYPDWIELYNGEETAVNLEGFYLSDDSLNLTKYPIPASISIPAGGFILFYADNDPEQGDLHTNFGLGAGGETVLLVGSDGTTIIDSYTFGPQTADVSEGRLPDGADNWTFFTTPTPGQSNSLVPPMISGTMHFPATPESMEDVLVRSTITDADGAVIAATLYYSATGSFSSVPMSLMSGDTYEAMIPGFAAGTLVDYYITADDDDGLQTSDPQGAPNDVYSYVVDYTPPALVINEFMASNDTTLEDPDEPGDFPDWIEIYNMGSETVDLGGMYLSDDPNDSRKYEIPAGVVVPANGFILFYADGQPEQGAQHTNFNLSAGGESILLFASDANGNLPIDSYTYSTQVADISEGRCPDGTGEWQFFISPTPGGANACLGAYSVYLPIVRK